MDNTDIITTEDNSTVIVTEPVIDPIPVAVQRYIDGDDVRDIAKDNHVSRQTIYNWMFSELGDKKEVEKLITFALIRKIADADDKLETATTGLDLARARELARFARMDFERRRPKLYGSQQGQANALVQVNIQR